MLAYSAGNALIGSPRGDSVWLFGLEGTLPPVEPGVPVNRLAAALPSRVRRRRLRQRSRRCRSQAVADTENGKRVYEQTCVICHGEDGLGGHGGGAPLNNVPNAAAVAAVVTAGRNNMPALSTLLTPVEIRDVLRTSPRVSPRRALRTEARVVKYQRS